MLNETRREMTEGEMVQSYKSPEQDSDPSILPTPSSAELLEGLFSLLIHQRATHTTQVYSSTKGSGQYGVADIPLLTL